MLHIYSLVSLLEVILCTYRQIFRATPKCSVVCSKVMSYFYLQDSESSEDESPDKGMVCDVIVEVK